MDWNYKQQKKRDSSELLTVYCEHFAENVSYVTVSLLLHLYIVLLDRTQTLKIKGFKQEFK